MKNINYCYMCQPQSVIYVIAVKTDPQSHSPHNISYI
jgi:hypothetical protein